MEDRDGDMERIQQALDILSEHFDAVHIFASRHEAEIEDGTIHCQKGVGNWFARWGQITQWVKVEEYISCRQQWDKSKE